MLAEIQSAVVTLNAISALTKAVISSKVDAALREQAIETQSALIDLNNTIFSLQSQNQSLLREKDELEKRLIEMENWQSEAQKYTLIEMTEGVFVYALKPDHKTTSPAHWLCPNCYHNKKQSILQLGYSRIRHKNTFNCPSCGLELIDHSNKAMPS